MESQHTGRTYRVTIGLPLAYSKSPDEGWPFDATPPKWPVVYLLDGNWYFGMVTDIIRPMAWCGSTSDAIVVGIGYAEDKHPVEAFRESFTRRNADLTPVRDEAEEKSIITSLFGARRTSRRSTRGSRPESISTWASWRKT